MRSSSLFLMFAKLVGMHFTSVKQLYQGFTEIANYTTTTYKPQESAVGKGYINPSLWKALVNSMKLISVSRSGRSCREIPTSFRTFSIRSRTSGCFPKMP